MGRKIAINNLSLDLDTGRSQMDRDAIEQYKQAYHAGKSKAVHVQAETYRLIDGYHRVQAARELGMEHVWAEELDVSDDELLELAYHYNSAHGVPYSTEERNRIIYRLYTEYGKPQSKIARMTGLTQQAVSKILSANSNGNGGNNNAKLKEKDMPVIARLLLNGESQEEVARKFNVARTTITWRWNEYRDSIKADYESGKLKLEVAEKYSLNTGEIDRILRGYGDPVNFTPQHGSLWTGFKIDERFGKRHPGNLPADLIRNLLYFYSTTGEVILDPFAGGGVVLDVAEDMVNRRAYGFDIAPVRSDIRKHDITSELPPCPEEPALIFLDPPYGPMKSGEYSGHSSELAEMDVRTFLETMGEIFSYWNRGKIILVMGCLKKDGEFVALPYACASQLEKQGCKLIDWIANEVNRSGSENPVSVSNARKHRRILRNHVDIIVAEK